jgi:flavin reductase (DIM6/NTAB) family NADH-FMN oxidoreductase RutF
MFKEIKITEVKENVVEMISKEWMLITCKSKDGLNMMTASWGFLGEMWNKDCVICAVRPTRYTYECLENEEYFSLCFLGKNKEPHKICGYKSGRDIDKLKETGLSAIYDENAPYFEEARMVIICKKLYADTLKEENFIDKSVAEKNYNNDFHKMYYSEIVKVLVKE